MREDNGRSNDGETDNDSDWQTDGDGEDRCKKMMVTDRTKAMTMKQMMVKIKNKGNVDERKIMLNDDEWDERKQ